MAATPSGLAAFGPFPRRRPVAPANAGLHDEIPSGYFCWRGACRDRGHGLHDGGVGGKISGAPTFLSAWGKGVPNADDDRNVGAPLDAVPRSAGVLACGFGRRLAACAAGANHLNPGGTPGGTPGEPAGEDARATTERTGNPNGIQIIQPRVAQLPWVNPSTRFSTLKGLNPAGANGCNPLRG